VDENTVGALALAIASLVALALGWAVGVMGKVGLINSYRAHPERYPDAQGLARWMGLTFGAGGLSFAFCALAWGAGAVGQDGAGPWAGGTAAFLVAFALGGLARYRRAPVTGGGAGKGK
jgi:hypothetical protein